MCSNGLNIKGEMTRSDTWDTLTPLQQQWTFMLFLHSKGYEFITVVEPNQFGGHAYHGKVYWNLFGAREINDIIINVLTQMNEHFVHTTSAQGLEEKKYIGGWIAKCCRELTRRDH
jgi:hypothetical protein